MADLATDQTITYSAIPTNIGLTKIQLAMTTGVDLILDQMAFGDGNGETPEPSPDQTSLVNQLGSVPILGHEEDLEDNVTWYSGIIEAGIASGTIRELGLFDRDGNLCFVGNIPDIVLPNPMEGVAINIPIQLGIKNYYSKYISIKTHIKVTEQIAGSGGYSLFDLVQKDHLLSYEESEGFALQGTFVYKEGIADERYGYPDFIQECLNEKNDERTISQRVPIGTDTIRGYIHPNGHIFYDISEKAKVDNYFEQTGVAWFWGIDEENERVFLPRNNYFFKNSSIDPGSFNPATLPSLAHTHPISMDSAGTHSHTITIGNNGTHSHTITVSSAGGHTHTEEAAGTHTHTGTIGDTSLVHYHQGGELQVTIKGTGILSSSALTDLVKKGTINDRVVNKGVTYRRYYNNFYSGAIYMDPAEINMRSTYFDDTIDGTGEELRTWRVLNRDGAATDTSFPDVNNGNCGWNGGLVRFDSSRYHQTWTGISGSPVNELEQSTDLSHSHELTIDNNGSHTHTINSVANHTHSATNSENGSHTHSATNNENGSHTHSGEASSVEIVAESMLGSTVTPPATNLLLYIVVGNVRRRPAMVIDEKLEEALETIDEHVEVKKIEIDEYVENKETVFEGYVQEGIQEIDTKVAEVEEEISGYTEEAKEYSIISKEQAEISEYWAGISIAGQVQADWNQTNPNEKSYIKNKPDLDLANTVYVNKTQTLTNKTIDATDNTISNIGLDNISSELIVTNITSSSTDTTLATAKAIWDAIQSVIITLDNIDPNLIINNLSESTVSNNTLATSLAIWNAIQDIPNYDFVVNSITQNTASNTTIGTTLATWNAIQSVNADTVQLIEDVDQSIRSIPILTQKVINTIDNPAVVSDNSLPTSLAVYRAILNSLDKTRIEGRGIVRVDTRLSTTTNVQTSNPNLVVTSSYHGTQAKTGTIIYKFEYNNSWKLNGVSVNLNNYYLAVSGSPQTGDVITLTYTTISTTTVRVDLDNVSELVDYYTISHTPNYIFTKGLGTSSNLDTKISINSSNSQLVITSNYQPAIAGEEEYSFQYHVNEEDPLLTGWYIEEELVDLTNYGITITGTPEAEDEFTITYNTKDFTYVYTDIEYSNGLTVSENLKTSVYAYCTNNLVTVKSIYTGTQSSEGIIDYTFQYDQVTEESDGWIDINTDTEIDPADYGIEVYGEPEWGDIIYLSYITTKGKTSVSVDLSTINDLTTSNFRSGVITTSIRSASMASDSAIPTEKAVREAINDAGGGGGSGSVTPESDTVFKNKTIDADDNTITDLTTSNFKSGVLQTTVRATASASDTALASEKAIASALDNTVKLTGTQTVTGTKTINNLNSTTQSVGTSGTSVATTKFSRCLQAYQPISSFSGGNVVLQDDVSVYQANSSISTTTTFSFDTTNLHYLSNSVFYTFELKFTVSSVASIVFPDETILTWQDGEIPDFSQTGTYLLAFRTMDGGTHWIGNLQGKWE